MCQKQKLNFIDQCNRRQRVQRSEISFLGLNLISIISCVPFPVAARSNAWVCDCSPDGIARSNPTGTIDACLDCCVLSGRGLCDELIIRQEESYRLWWVVVCDIETS